MRLVVPLLALPLLAGCASSTRMLAPTLSLDEAVLRVRGRNAQIQLCNGRTFTAASLASQDGTISYDLPGENVRQTRPVADVRQILEVQYTGGTNTAVLFGAVAGGVAAATYVYGTHNTDESPTHDGTLFLGMSAALGAVAGSAVGYVLGKRVIPPRRTVLYDAGAVGCQRP